MMPSRTPRARLPLLITGAFLAAGSLACLGYLLWPSSTPTLPEIPAGRPVPTVLGTAKTPVNGRPAGKGTRLGPTGTEHAGRLGNAPAVSSRAAGERMAPPHKVMTPPPQTAENTIKGPLPWRINGPPVKTPAPGRAAAKPPQLTVLGRAASPDGTHRNVQGQSLPFLLPARSNPNPAPANGVPRAN